MKYEPLISCIITTCNRTKLLERCILSLQNQTYKNIEIIVVNDCDKINITKKINMNNVIFIKNKFLKGVQGARNTGLISAKGEYIYMIDDDDFASDFLFRLIPLLKQHNVISTAKVIKKKEYFQHKEDKLYLTHLLKDNLCHLGGIIFKNKDLPQFDTRFTSCQDWDFFIQLIMKYHYFHVVYFPFITIDESENIRISTNHHRKLKGHLKIYRKYYKFLNIESTYSQKRIYYNLKSNFSNLYYKKINYLIKSMKYAKMKFKLAIKIIFIVLRIK